MLNVLITGGGTRIKIDSVRNITNFSKGTFASKIATEFLKAGHDVTYLCAENARTPFKLEVKHIGWGLGKTLKNLADLHALHEEFGDNYSEWQYNTYEAYSKALHTLCTSYKPDIVILAAAVSDYGVENEVQGKVRSKDNLAIHLKPLPKLIKQVKQWLPNTFLVGFKLLVGTTNEELDKECLNSCNVNGCDLVVGNDWEQLKANNHTLRITAKAHNYVNVLPAEDNAKYLTEYIINEYEKQPAFK